MTPRTVSTARLNGTFTRHRDHVDPLSKGMFRRIERYCSAFRYGSNLGFFPRANLSRRHGNDRLVIVTFTPNNEQLQAFSVSYDATDRRVCRSENGKGVGDQGRQFNTWWWTPILAGGTGKEHATG